MIKAWNKEIKFKKYPNGELMIDFEASELMWLRKAAATEQSGEFIDIEPGVVEFKWEDDSDLIKLMFLKEYVAEHFGGNVLGHLVIYSMPYARSDRSENGSPFMLKLVADFINYMMWNKVSIVEPHSDVTLKQVGNSEVIHIVEDLLTKVMDDVKFDAKKDYIVFPDRGSAHRYDKLGYDAKGYNTMFFTKDRDFETGEIKGLTPVGGKDVEPNSKAIIIDDMSSYGGTFYYSGLELKKLGFNEVHLVICHCEDTIFEGKLMNTDHPIKNIYTTDTMFTANSYGRRKLYESTGKLKVYNIEEILKEVI